MRVCLECRVVDGIVSNLQNEFEEWKSSNERDQSLYVSSSSLKVSLSIPGQVMAIPRGPG